MTLPVPQEDVFGMQNELLRNYGRGPDALFLHFAVIFGAKVWRKGHFYASLQISRYLLTKEEHDVTATSWT